MDMKARLSTLWVFVMLNIIFADILSFLSPGFLEEVSSGQAGGVHITPLFLLAAGVIGEIAIAMVVLSRFLDYRLNRWANIGAAVLLILWIHYTSVVFLLGGVVAETWELRKMQQRQRARLA